MSQNMYKNFLNLLKKWPADETKKGRDIGEFIRNKVAQNFPKGDISTVSNPNLCTKNLESLNRIAKNYHSNKYPRLYNSTAMGLTPEISGKCSSNEVIEECNNPIHASLSENYFECCGFFNTESFYLEILIMPPILLRSICSLTARTSIAEVRSYSVYNLLHKILEPSKLIGVSKSFSQVSHDEEFQTSKPHIPVLRAEVLNALDVKKNGVYLDMTFGAGGHTQAILEKDPSIVVFGLDRDPHTKKFADEVKEIYPNRFHYLCGKFSDLPNLLAKCKIKNNYFNGILMDLGVSSMQFNNPERGFMLSQNGPLDMRMGGESDEDTPTVSQVLAHIDEESLYRVIKYFGQEKKARIISRAIIDSRALFKSLKTTKELAQLIESVIGVGQTDKLQRFSHPATKTFQALRILVNDEMNQLDLGIRLAHNYLQPFGILAGISFHSLEDTLLKRHFTSCDLDKTPASIGLGLRKHRKSYLSTYTHDEISDIVLKPWQPLTKHVVVPSDEEVNSNPRSRSAKLRIASKIHCPLYY